MKLSIFLLISLFSGVAICSIAQPKCIKSDDCGSDECCVLGMERYSIPQCKKKGEPGEWCRAGAVPEDRILYYPNQDILEVYGVYTLFCPCDDGLICAKSKCTNETTSKILFPGIKFKG